MLIDGREYVQVGDLMVPREVVDQWVMMFTVQAMADSDTTLSEAHQRAIMEAMDGLPFHQSWDQELADRIMANLGIPPA
jgi:hypothetical protein